MHSPTTRKINPAIAEVVQHITNTRSKPQFIVAVDNAYFEENVNFREGVTLYPIARFLFEAQPFLAIREREWLEKNPSYRQLIPYTVITVTTGDSERLYWSYQRMSGVGEQRLAGKVSVGFGGHIDLGSVVFTNDSVLDLDATIRLSCDREIEEEVRAQGEVVPLYSESKRHATTAALTAPEYDNRFILHHEGVHAVHAGIVMTMDVSRDLKLSCAEEELQMLKPMTAWELLNGNYDLELWTRSYLQDGMNNAIKLGIV